MRKKKIAHGKASTYTNYRCRCARCTKAHREALRRWRAKVALQ